MKTIITAILCVLALAEPTNALAQEDATERARRILAESQAHHEAGREALAAEGYLQLYEALREIGRAGAPVALWNAGNALAEVPGRERDAIATLRRFLDESTILTDDPQIRTWRSTAVGLIAELEARAPQSGQDLGEPDGSGAEEPTPPPTSQGSSVSPVGPVLLGVGGATLIPGLILAAVGLIQNQDLINRCPERVGCDDTVISDAEATRTLGIAGDVLWIVGASVAIAGLVLTLTLEDDADGERVEAQLEGVHGGGVASLRGRFQ